MRKQNKKWRRRYQYQCADCGKTRFTLKYQRRTSGQCTLCQQTQNPNQTSLFPEMETFTSSAKTVDTETNSIMIPEKSKDESPNSSVPHAEIPATGAIITS